MKRLQLEAAFATTARRRLRRAQDLLASGAADAGRYLGRELHALGGEATFLGFAEIYGLVRDGEELARGWDPAAGPTASAPIAATLSAIADRLPPSPEHDGPRPRRVLIIADSVSHAWLLRDVLEHEGFETTVVTDASARFEQGPDVVLCSLTSSDRLDAAVRELRERSGAPLLLVSSETREGLAREAARVHADGFVSTAAGLVAAVAEIREHAT